MAIVLEGGYEYISTAESVAATIMGSIEDMGFKSIEDIETYFGIDDDYRETRVKNSLVLDRVAGKYGIDR